jgi:hypothetical protein
MSRNRDGDSLEVKTPQLAHNEALVAMIRQIADRNGQKDPPQARVSGILDLATKVRDSWALMAFLHDEPAAEEVEKLLVKAAEEIDRYLSARRA